MERPGCQSCGLDLEDVFHRALPGALEEGNELNHRWLNVRQEVPARSGEHGANGVCSGFFSSEMTEIGKDLSSLINTQSSLTLIIVFMFLSLMLKAEVSESPMVKNSVSSLSTTGN